MKTLTNFPNEFKLELEKIGGICIFFNSDLKFKQALDIIENWHKIENIDSYVEIKSFEKFNLHFLHLTPKNPLFDITEYSNTLNLTNDIGCSLEKEIVLAMVRCPVTYIYPSCDELFASLRIRRNAALAARKTQITFDTEAALRPKEYWTYIEDNGFILNINKSIIEALTKTIHPTDEQLFSFACSRACEHVMLLALTQELAITNPELLRKIEALWQKKALLNADFDNAFMQEHGSFNNPLPIRFFVPGDRVWFCNPDEYSTNVTGFEGSWVIYLGSGCFSNFWNFQDPTPLEQKCLEMFHWRNGIEVKEDGEFWMNEPHVAERVKSSKHNTDERKTIITQMMKQYNEHDYYENGGFVPPTREELRLVCHPTFEILKFN